ncbi:hypothetical protein OU787_17480 [Kitasatospora sp. YST-16]|uniref:hypothetical protein n=1 Tax=Kitasatospora sp. YST-16 TaxID=2998080 RepID=UPI002284BB04|nr:hypothetical protein [Kitasatospora sp. YST-16]WAL73142.1 hypothetical protein OU787_17480 [Kitasatospora sp. YST-16]WNW39196.1 hypothetical protein RKE32_17445 [Streptomyces sp. Li-HN-5-13]
MAEAVEGSDMTNFSAWAIVWVFCLAVAFAVAWVLSGDEPTGRHRAGDRPIEPYVIELRGQRRAGWAQIDHEAQPAPTTPAVRPATPNRPPVPARALALKIKPGTKLRKPPTDYSRATVTRRTDELEMRVRQVRAQQTRRTVAQTAGSPLEDPRPAAGRVVPLYVLRWEAEQQDARRKALEAASAGLPDTGYSYPGAQTLTGAVA